MMTKYSGYSDLLDDFFVKRDKIFSLVNSDIGRKYAECDKELDITFDLEDDVIFSSLWFCAFLAGSDLYISAKELEFIKTLFISDLQRQTIVDLCNKGLKEMDDGVYNFFQNDVKGIDLINDLYNNHIIIIIIKLIYLINTIKRNGDSLYMIPEIENLIFNLVDYFEALGFAFIAYDGIEDIEVSTLTRVIMSTKEFLRYNDIMIPIFK